VNLFIFENIILNLFIEDVFNYLYDSLINEEQVVYQYFIVNEIIFIVLIHLKAVFIFFLIEFVIHL
jgi:hypothetical protein